MSPCVICLTGPTASGKSAAAMQIAARWPVEIVVMDSATIYRGMDIGTAKPTAHEQRRVPHHLLDIRDPAQSYSAADFACDAAQRILEIRARGRIPLLCGGTMLYYKSLREGLSDLPQADADLRAHIDARAQAEGWPALHAELAHFDPDTARRLAPHDRQRLQRALEVYYSSGRTLSQWLAQGARSALPGWRFETLSLEPSDRKVLHDRIRQRFDQMLAHGLLDEVRRLHARPDLHPGLPSVRCVGYRQLWDYLSGRTSLEHAVERAVIATRQLAKRQMTWLRALPGRYAVDALDPHAASQVLALFDKFADAHYSGARQPVN